jgi:hypothetical protein
MQGRSCKLNPSAGRTMFSDPPLAMPISFRRTARLWEVMSLDIMAPYGFPSASQNTKLAP